MLLKNQKNQFFYVIMLFKQILFKTKFAAISTIDHCIVCFYE